MSETDTRPGPAAPPRGKSGLSAKKAGLPVWAWVLGGTVLAGVAFIWYRNRQSGAAAANTAANAGGPATEATTIVPVDQGLAQSQYDALRAQISDLQGEVSREQKAEAADAKTEKTEAAELEALEDEDEAEDKRAPKRKKKRPAKKPATHTSGNRGGGGGSGPGGKKK